MARTTALSSEELEQIDSVWKAPGLKPTLVAVFCAFGGWALLLPVIPLAIIDNGGSDGLAGLSTGVFMGATVLTQAFTPRVLRAVGYMPVMFVAGLLLGIPAIIYAADMSAGTVLVVAAIRGVGFGAATVTEAALIAELVPPRLVGRSSGVFGATVGIAQLLSFPLGMWLYGSFSMIVVLLVASVYSVVGGIAALQLPRPRDEHAEHAELTAAHGDVTGAHAGHGTGDDAEALEHSTESMDFTPARPRASTWKLVTIPGFAIGAAAGGFAAFSTFLAPAAAQLDASAAATISGFTLSIIGGMQIMTRLFSGWYADRVGEPGRLYGIGLLLCLLGLAAAAATITAGSSGLTLALCALGSAALFGAGFGVVQTEALLMMFDRLPREESAKASALWNMTFDSGTGLGAVVLGFVAGAFAYQGAFVASAAVVTVALIAAGLDRVVGRHRISEYNNVRETLRSLRQRSGAKKDK